MIERRTKVLLLVFLVVVLGAAAASYYRYMILGNVTFITEGFSLEEEEEATEEETEEETAGEIEAQEGGSEPLPQ